MSVKFVKQPKYKIVDKTKELSADSLKKINQKLSLSTTNFKAKLQKLFDKSLPDSLVELFGKGDILVTITKDKKTGGYLLNFSNLGTADGESLDLVKGVPDISRKMSTGTTESGIRDGSRSVTTPKIQKDAVDNGAKKGKEKPKSVVDESLDKAEKMLKNKEGILGFSLEYADWGSRSIDIIKSSFSNRSDKWKDLIRRIIRESLSNGVRFNLSSDDFNLIGVDIVPSDGSIKAEFWFHSRERFNNDSYVTPIDVRYWKETFKKIVLKEVTKKYGVKFNSKLQVKPLSGVGDIDVSSIKIFNGSANLTKLRDLLSSGKIMKSRLRDLISGLKSSAFIAFVKLSKFRDPFFKDVGFYPECNLGNIGSNDGDVFINVRKVSGGYVLEVYSEFSNSYIESVRNAMISLGLTGGYRALGVVFKYKSFEDLIRNSGIFRVDDSDNLSGISNRYAYSLLRSKSDFGDFEELFINSSKLPRANDYYNNLDIRDLNFDERNQNGDFRIRWRETPGVYKSTEVKFTYDKKSEKFKVTSVGKIKVEKYEVPSRTLNLSTLDKYFYCPECGEYYGKSNEYFDTSKAGDVWECSNCGEGFLLKGKVW